MDTPTLEITAAAREALLQQMASITSYQPVVAIDWCVGASWGQLLPNSEENITVLGPHWAIGYNDSAKVPPTEVFEISGIPFVFGVPGKMIHRLSGATLNYIAGNFEVEERAI